MSNKTVKVVVYGAHGVGKTTLLDTLPQDTTLVLSAEAGLNSVPHWQDKDCIITPRDFGTFRAVAACLTQPDPEAIPGLSYSAEYKERALKAVKTDLGTPLETEKYTDLFIDSITVISQICRKWASKQPDCFTQQAKLDMRKVYGKIADEMIAFFTQLQHAPMNVWFVGALDKVVNDLGETAYEPAMEGGKTAKRLIGIVDDVVTMTFLEVKKDEETTEKRRVFITNTDNPWGYPAKTRSGLAMVEPAHLGRIADKIRNAPKERTLVFDQTPIEFDQIIY